LVSSLAHLLRLPIHEPHVLPSCTPCVLNHLSSALHTAEQISENLHLVRKFLLTSLLGTLSVLCRKTGKSLSRSRATGLLLAATAHQVLVHLPHIAVVLEASAKQPAHRVIRTGDPSRHETRHLVRRVGSRTSMSLLPEPALLLVLLTKQPGKSLHEVLAALRLCSKRG
jgi:hypothetical protein